MINDSPSTPAEPAAPSPSVATHTVAPGDTLYAIGNRYGVSAGQLQQWNALGTSTLLTVGQVLRVAPPTTPAPTVPVTPTTSAEGDGTQAATVLGWGPPIPELSDEFDYTGRPKAELWSLPGSFGTGWPGHSGNGRRMPEQTVVHDGMMTLTGLANGDTGWVQHKARLRYMRVECRSRSRTLEANTDPNYHILHLVWPSELGWPRGGEYDFLEYTDPDTTKASGWLHYPHEEGATQQVRWTRDGIDVRQWHNWAFEWLPTGLWVYCDGQLVFTGAGGAREASGGAPKRYDLQSMPVGRLTHQVDMFKTTGTRMRPAVLDIDWVRFYAVPA